MTKACESGVVFKYEPSAKSLPEQSLLYQNYSNPFNPSTKVSFALTKGGEVTLEIYNNRGQKVATLADGYFSAGLHVIQWNASDKASGVYLYRLTASDFTETRKMILMK